MTDPVDEPIVEHVDTLTPGDTADPTIGDIYDTLTQEQQDVVNYLIGAAVEEALSGNVAAQSDDSESIEHAGSPLVIANFAMMNAEKKNDAIAMAASTQWIFNLATRVPLAAVVQARRGSLVGMV